MTRYKLLEGKKGEVLLGIFLFVLLVLSRNTLFTSTILGFGVSQVTMFALVGVTGIWFLLVNRNNLKAIVLDRRILAALAFSVILLLPMVCKGDWQTMYFSVLLCLYVAVFLSYLASMEKIARYFVVFMTCLGAYSILAEYVLAAMVDAGWFRVPVVVYHESRSFYSFGLAFTVIKNNYFRNYGIFREPGIYQFFLILALYLNNDQISWEKSRRQWVINGILALAMVSTFSTGGVIELCLLAAVIFFEKKLYRDKRILAAVAVCGLLGIGALVVIILQKGALYRTLFTMVEKLFVINDSSGSRYEAILVDLDIFLHNPLLGGRFAETLNAVKHNTSSTLLLYAVYGIGGGTLHVAGFTALVWKKDRSFLVNGLLVLILLMAVNTQNFTTDVFFWLFPTMALMERGLPLLEKKG